MSVFRSRVRILGTQIDRINAVQASEQIVDAAADRSAGYVCAANVHMVMEGWDDPAFQSMVNSASLVVPDGMPLVWAMRLLRCPEQRRVYGPALMTNCLRLAAERGVRVGLLGGKEGTLEKLIFNFNKSFPGIRIVYTYSYPYRKVSSCENRQIIENITAAGTELLFVGLGCPKQEKWMASWSSVLPMILVGVGAAFDFHAGDLPVAPRWLQRAGLEWAYRLRVEPRRLFKRYAKHNPRFIFHFSSQLADFYMNENRQSPKT
jgi:N-acetylglucosaminyldiphosphoundecaprenol N-acetyl-beta-D-mannosaminyltransferase